MHLLAECSNSVTSRLFERAGFFVNSFRPYQSYTIYQVCQTEQKRQKVYFESNWFVKVVLSNWAKKAKRFKVRLLAYNWVYGFLSWKHRIYILNSIILPLKNTAMNVSKISLEIPVLSFWNIVRLDLNEVFDRTWSLNWY